MFEKHWLERWLSTEEHLLLLQRPWFQFLAPTLGSSLLPIVTPVPEYDIIFCPLWIAAACEVHTDKQSHT